MKIILVEGKTDKIIVDAFLEKFGLSRHFSTEAVHGKSHLRNYLAHKTSNQREICAVLLESDQLGLSFARQRKVLEFEHLDFDRVKLFFVIPEIEAWLLADKETLINFCKSDSTRLVIERITTPEEVSYPKMILSNAFGNLKEALKRYPDLIEEMNLSRAISSSYTLRDFYYGLLEIVEMPTRPSDKIWNFPNYTNIESKNYKTLLMDSANLDQIAFKTLEGNEYTFRNLLDEIGSESDVGKEYVFNLLRSARDILSYQARKAGSKK